MSDDIITIKVKGLQEIKATLEELAPRIARKVLRAGVSAGGMLLRGEIKNSTPIRSDGKMKKAGNGELRGPGYLKRKISSRYRKRASSFNEVHYMIGPAGQAFYGYFVEGGHKVGAKKKYGRGIAAANAGRADVPPHPFIVPAFNRMTAPIIDRMKSKLSEGIIKEGGELGFKTGGTVGL